MSDPNNGTGYTGLGRRAPPPTPPGVVKPRPTIAAQADKPVGRHAAIRTKLPNWSSYRNWVAKVRERWDEKK